MVTQEIYIPKYDWRVIIDYDASPIDTKDILFDLKKMGCHPDALVKAGRMLRSGIPNQGLTYSAMSERLTLIVIGEASSVGEFISTVVHEVDHLTDHISQYYGIPYESEENSYLIGDISKRITEGALQTAKRFFGL